jgi:hypothetical protein
LIEARKSQFEDLLSRATRMVENFFLCPASTPAVEVDTLPIQLSMPQGNAPPCKPSSAVSIPTPSLSTAISDLYQQNNTTLIVKKAPKNATLPLEEDNLDTLSSQLYSQSEAESRISLTSNF